MSEIKNNSEVTSSEINEAPVDETGGETLEATRNDLTEQINKIGGFDDSALDGSFEEFDEPEAVDEQEINVEKRGFINSAKEFLSKHGGDILKLGVTFWKLYQTIKGNPQDISSTVSIPFDSLKLAYSYAKNWAEIRKMQDTNNPYGIIDADTTNEYQFSDSQKDEDKIGFDD